MLSWDLCLFKCGVTATSDQLHAGTFRSGAEDYSVRGGFPEPGKRQGHGESRQELAAVARAADEAWTGPGVTVANPRTCKRQPLGSTSDQGGQTGHLYLD